MPGAPTVSRMRSNSVALGRRFAPWSSSDGPKPMGLMQAARRVVWSPSDSAFPPDPVALNVQYLGLWSSAHGNWTLAFLAFRRSYANLSTRLSWLISMFVCFNSKKCAPHNEHVERCLTAVKTAPPISGADLKRSTVVATNSCGVAPFSLRPA